MIADTHTLFTSLFDAAVSAADPGHAIPRYLPDKLEGRIVVIGAGKASAQIATAFEKAWPPDGMTLDDEIASKR